MSHTGNATGTPGPAVNRTHEMLGSLKFSNATGSNLSMQRCKASLQHLSLLHIQQWKQRNHGSGQCLSD
eukprot:1159093-Pelagomonas_calceolata.AAC.6